jgi:hypothetical protein
MTQFRDLDLSKDQHLMSIIINGDTIGDILIEDGQITTQGQVGYNVYDNFVQLIYGLQGFGITIDNFYY